MVQTIIEHGLVVTDSGRFRADLLIDDERIVGLVHDASDIAADERIDASGLLVMPGGIDVHTHFREPDPELVEGFQTGGEAGAAGGITTVVEMPQAQPTTTTLAHLREKQDLLRLNAIADMALWAGVIGEPEQDPGTLWELANAGVAGFKSFMASSSPFFPAVDNAKLYYAMATIAEIGIPYGLHAEDDALLKDGLRRMKEAGRQDPLAHADSRPPLVEVVAVNAALYLAEVTGCWIHICHAAAAEAIALIAAARERGVRVTVETCPQYLVLNTDDLALLKGFGRCAPAIREQEEVDAIWPFVLDETVDLICSDHCGFTIASKQPGETDIFSVPLGLSGIQTLLPSFFDAAVNQRGVDETQFVRQISTNPAKIFGLYPRKGTIALGADADIILFNPDHEWTVRGEEMLHRQQWTPLEGKTIKGRVIRTVRRGETIYDESGKDGEIRLPALPGSGKFLERGYGESGS
jgi:allantoinase